MIDRPLPDDEDRSKLIDAEQLAVRMVEMGDARGAILDVADAPAELPAASRLPALLSPHTGAV